MSQLASPTLSNGPGVTDVTGESAVVPIVDDRSIPRWPVLARWRGSLVASVLPVIALGFAAIPAEGAVIGGTGYRGFSDSAFSGLDFSSGYFHLETFEDHALNTPGVTATAGLGITSTQGYTGDYTDSVDEDDGAVDGRCQYPTGAYCDGYYGAGPPGAGIAFEFDDEVLGNLPTHVGVVWTDGINPVSFEALDEAGSVLGSYGPANPAGPGFFGNDVAEDIFIAAVFPDGIKSIRITGGAFGGMEVDHLQYGFGAQVPAPGALPLMLTALLSTIGASRLRKR